MPINGDEDELKEHLKKVDSLTLANRKFVKGMTLMLFHKVRELEHLKDDLKKEKQNYQVALSKITYLHTLNVDLAKREEMATKAHEASENKLRVVKDQLDQGKEVLLKVMQDFEATKV